MDEQYEGEDRLSELRIQQLATLRRSLYRSRSHAILAAILCVVAGAEFIRYAIFFFRERAIGWTIGFALASVVAIALSILAARRAIALNRECQRPPEAPPEVEPDFSQLSDGSQRWKNLEDIR